MSSWTIQSVLLILVPFVVPSRHIVFVMFLYVFQLRQDKKRFQFEHECGVGRSIEEQQVAISMLRQSNEFGSNTSADDHGCHRKIMHRMTTRICDSNASTSSQHRRVGKKDNAALLRSQRRTYQVTYIPVACLRRWCVWRACVCVCM